MIDWFACEGCKYDDNGDCTFYEMGSGNEIDKPCHREEEMANRALKHLIDAFLEGEADG